METFYLVTPSFDAAGTILETVRSVLDQSQECHIIYHVQDGASTDATRDILRSVEEELLSAPARYSHVTFSWESAPDNGMYHAIAKAFERLGIPSNAFMGWINADDILTTGCFATIMEAVRDFPQIVWCGGNPRSRDQFGHEIPSPTFHWHSRVLIRAGICDGVHLPCLQQEGMFWRKSLFDDCGGLDTTMRLAGDWDLWRRMGTYADFVLLPQATGIFHKRPGQLSEDVSRYEKEIASILPKALRRKRLQTMMHDPSSLTAVTARREPDGKLVLAEISISSGWPFKNRLRIFCAMRGWYWAIHAYQFMLKLFRRARASAPLSSG